MCMLHVCLCVAQMAYMPTGERLGNAIGQVIGTKLLQPPVTKVRAEEATGAAAEASYASTVTARLTPEVNVYCQIITCIMLLILPTPPGLDLPRSSPAQKRSCLSSSCSSPRW